MLKILRKLVRLLAILAIPFVLVWIYLAFFASEPVFAPEDDVGLGLQVVESLNQEPGEYPVLSREEYPEAYAHIDRITKRLVQGSAIQYEELFQYDQVRLIHDDETLNAFCTPGGFIYVYTGLIKYLEQEDHLAGVMGHEIAHAELRHSSLRLQKEYGAKRLLDFVLLTSPMSLREAGALVILNDLTSLKYSRDQEAQSDDLSVRYLADAGYACDGTAGFFEKLLANQADAGIPEVLSDHPDSQSRVRDIHSRAQQSQCDTTPADQSQWRAFQASLP
jgi:predicted Zn-dependent protease